MHEAFASFLTLTAALFARYIFLTPRAAAARGLTHKGWLLFLPVYMLDLDDEVRGPCLWTRIPATEILMPLVTLLCMPLQGFPVAVTGELPTAAGGKDAR